MRCEAVRERLSELVDGGGASPELAAHVRECGACAAELERLTAAVLALRAAGPTETAPRVKAAILAAVDAAASADARGSDEDFRRAALLAGARFGSRARRRRVATHAAALLAGAALVLLWLAPWRSERPAETSPPERVVVEVPVHVPGPLREVPFLVEVERPVVHEVVREVSREVVRVERRGPLLALDTDGLEEALVGAARALARAVQESRPAPAVGPELAADPETPRRPLVAAADAELASARLLGTSSVLLRRSGPRLALETRGGLAEVVPVLLAKLEHDDEDVAALVERRLSALRDEAAANPELAPRLRPAEVSAEPRRGRGLFRRAFGGEERTPTERERWTAWWEANGPVLVEAEALGSL